MMKEYYLLQKKVMKIFQSSKNLARKEKMLKYILKDEVSHKPIGNGEKCIRSNGGQ